MRGCRGRLHSPIRENRASSWVSEEIARAYPSWRLASALLARRWVGFRVGSRLRLHPGGTAEGNQPARLGSTTGARVARRSMLKTWLMESSMRSPRLCMMWRPLGGHVADLETVVSLGDGYVDLMRTHVGSSGLRCMKVLFGCAEIEEGIGPHAGWPPVSK
jgi:hypothetical protein